MKRKGIIVVVSIALVLIVFCVLFLTGVIKINLKSNKDNKPNISHAVCYVKYMNSFMLITAEGDVVASVDTVPEGIPEIAGISYKSIVVGEKIEPNEQKEYKYALKITENFKKNSMKADQVYISSDKSASVHVDNVKILFGKDEDTEEKIRDLRDFYDSLHDLKGTLDMMELSENNAGYTFKKD